jgi:hypothetical protein
MIGQHRKAADDQDAVRHTAGRHRGAVLDQEDVSQNDSGRAAKLEVGGQLLEELIGD